MTPLPPPLLIYVAVIEKHFSISLSTLFLIPVPHEERTEMSRAAAEEEEEENPKRSSLASSSYVADPS